MRLTAPIAVAAVCLIASSCVIVAKGNGPHPPAESAPRTHVQTVTTSNAPAPVGPYSQARLAGNTLYLAGQ